MWHPQKSLIPLIVIKQKSKNIASFEGQEPDNKYEINCQIVADAFWRFNNWFIVSALVVYQCIYLKINLTVLKDFAGVGSFHQYMVLSQDVEIGMVLENLKLKG